MKVLIVVTHLLGTGHLARALTLARAYQMAGHTVTVASGGMPAPQLDRGDVPLLQLPPVRSDGVNFTTLLDSAGAPVVDATMAARVSCVLDHIALHAPDVLVTELFPFGRRILRDEFSALLQAAHTLPNRPLICASIRDILAPPSKPKKAALADAFIAEFYDAVLVHSDNTVTPLELSWPVSQMLETKLHYTGFVAPPAPSKHPNAAGTDEIIVSAGGGDVGAHIFAAALQAATQTPSRNWRILVGGADVLTRSNDMARTAPTNVTVEPARADFRQMLHHSAASISMCGYNTALDVLQTGCPAVFIPFDAGHEVEQGLRADALTKLPGIHVLRSADLTPERLTAAVLDVIATPRRTPSVQGFDGATRTVQITTKLHREMA